MGIITLCGSTKFKDTFLSVSKNLTLSNYIVLMPGVFGHADGYEMSVHTKNALDDLHLQKIDMSDSIYVVNSGQYIGESTKKELDYAIKHKKRIAFHEPLDMHSFEAFYLDQNGYQLCNDLFYHSKVSEEFSFTKQELDILQNISDKVYKLAMSNGKYNMNPAVSPLMLHVIDEVSEANKAYLSDAFADKTEVDILTNSFNVNRFKAYIKDKFEDEIADFILLGFSIAGYYNIKIGKHLGLKQKFNIERKEHSVTNNYNNTSK